MLVLITSFFGSFFLCLFGLILFHFGGSFIIFSIFRKKTKRKTNRAFQQKPFQSEKSRKNDL